MCWEERADLREDEENKTNVAWTDVSRSLTKAECRYRLLIRTPSVELTADVFLILL